MPVDKEQYRKNLKRDITIAIIAKILLITFLIIGAKLYKRSFHGEDHPRYYHLMENFS